MNSIVSLLITPVIDIAWMNSFVAYVLRVCSLSYMFVLTWVALTWGYVQIYALSFSGRSLTFCNVVSMHYTHETRFVLYFSLFVRWSRMSSTVCLSGHTHTLACVLCMIRGILSLSLTLSYPISSPGVSGMVAHSRTNTSSIKAFQCQECPRSYSSKYALVRHARQHTNSHLRACPFCGRTSTRADIIRVHMTNCVKKYIRTIEETALQIHSGEGIQASGGQDPDSYLLAITRLAAEQEAAANEAPPPSSSNKLWCVRGCVGFW